MTVKELIEELQQIVYKDQPIYVSIDGEDGLDILNLGESPFACFINVHNEEEDY
jgi:hypothetical protein